MGSCFGADVYVLHFCLFHIPADCTLLRVKKCSSDCMAVMISMSSNHLLPHYHKFHHIHTHISGRSERDSKDM